MHTTTTRRRRPGQTLAAGLLAVTLTGCTSTIIGEAEAAVTAAAAAAAPAPSQGPSEIPWLPWLEDLSVYGTNPSSSSPPPVSSSSGRPGPATTAPVKTQRGKILEWARSVDPCALHGDKAIVGKALPGMIHDSLMPNLGMAGCDLDLIPADKPDRLSTWQLSTTAGVKITAKARKEGKPEEIAGVGYLQVPDVLSIGDGRSCRYVKEIDTSMVGGPPPSTTSSPDRTGVPSPGADDTYGLELLVRVRTAEKQSQEACAVAKTYLAEVGKFWMNPALRSDKLTTPVFPLAEVDPCAAAAGLEADMRGPLQVTQSVPFACVLNPAPDDKGLPAFGSGVSVELGLDTDPVPLLTGKYAQEYKPITVAGRPGVSKQTGGSSGSGAPAADPKQQQLPGKCAISVVVDQNLAVRSDLSRPDSPTRLQTVDVSAPTCELASKAAAAVMATIPS